MNQDDLSKLLKDLPRDSASPGFTDRVLARLDAEPERTHRSLGWQLAAAATVVAVLASGWLARNTWLEAQEKRAAAARLESMRDEYRKLQLELDELRRLTSEAEPVFELGSSERVDFIFDLRRLAEEQGGARAVPTSAPR